MKQGFEHVISKVKSYSMKKIAVAAGIPQCWRL